jgi:hypothetical protein
MKTIPLLLYQSKIRCFIFKITVVVPNVVDTVLIHVQMGVFVGTPLPKKE